MKTKITAIVFAVALVAGGCSGSDDDPQPTPTADQSLEQAKKEAAERNEAIEKQLKDSQPVIVDITIAKGKVTPQAKRVDVKVGQPVLLNVTSDAADEIHVHSDPEHSLEVEPSDQPLKMTFTLQTPGQVAVESHHLGVTIVQLVVKP